jgi:hypothetical protein
VRPLAGRLGASGAEAVFHSYGNTVYRALPQMHKDTKEMEL